MKAQDPPLVHRDLPRCAREIQGQASEFYWMQSAMRIEMAVNLLKESLQIELTFF